MTKTCKDCEINETCGGNDSDIFPCPDFVPSKCSLVKDNVTLAPNDPGEPPSWVPPFPGGKIYWIDRELFDKLKELRYDSPCHICPDKIKNECERHTQ